jgi:hypothetical protein
MSKLPLGPADLRLPDSFDRCARSSPAFSIAKCFIFGGPFYPPRTDPSCATCEGLIYLQHAYRDHVASGGEKSDLVWFRRHYVKDNTLGQRVRLIGWRSEL